jgi:hypothetical protein
MTPNTHPKLLREKNEREIFTLEHDKTIDYTVRIRYPDARYPENLDIRTLLSML